MRRNRRAAKASLRRVGSGVRRKCGIRAAVVAENGASPSSCKFAALFAARKVTRATRNLDPGGGNLGPKTMFVEEKIVRGHANQETFQERHQPALCHGLARQRLFCVTLVRRFCGTAPRGWERQMQEGLGRRR